LIYDEGIDYALHKKRSTRKYPINTDAPKCEIFRIKVHVSRRVGLKKTGKRKNCNH